MGEGQIIILKSALLIVLLLTELRIVPPTILFAYEPPRPAAVTVDDAGPENAPIVERQLSFYNFNYRTVEGGAFDLREYAKGKSVIIVEYFAGWCKNSNRNGHVVERLWTKYRQLGLGVVGVAEYSDGAELRIHINRIGIDYPIVTETTSRDKMKKSLHYKYRRAVGDKRKWGTPFYVLIDTRDIDHGASNGPFASRVYTVSGELDEAEADHFIRERVAK